MAGQPLKKKTRESAKVESNQIPEDFQAFIEKSVKEGRAMHEKIFRGKDGSLIDADQFLQEMFE